MWTAAGSEPSVEGIGPMSTEILSKYRQLREVRKSIAEHVFASQHFTTMYVDSSFAHASASAVLLCGR